jgi:hypothetical protein
MPGCPPRRSCWLPPPCGDSRDWQRVWQIVFDAADDAEARPSFFSVQVHDPAWLEQRREIRSFFIREVDRDKVVLSGSP